MESDPNKKHYGFPTRSSIAKEKRKAELDTVTPKKWYNGPFCSTPDDQHVVEIADPDKPYWGKCLHCNEKFYIISESVLKENGLFAFVRQQLNKN